MRASQYSYIHASMESHKLDITLHSAKGLSDVKIFGTMDPYAIVWIAGDGKESKPRTTPVATKGASSPIWNYPMQFNLPPIHNNYTLFFEIKHKGKLIDRPIGEVQVPFANLNASGEKLSYPVKTCSGEESGEIIVSHKFSKSSVSSGEKNGGSSGGDPSEKNGSCSGGGPSEKNGSSSGGKVDGGPRKKVQGKKKKVEEKKKGGMLKRVAGRVATAVATEAVLLAGTVGITLALGGAFEETEVKQDGDEGEGEGEGDEEYEDEDEEGEYDEEDEEGEYDEEDEYI